MTATHISNVNIWKEVANRQERSARLMTLVSIALGFALLASFSYSYASVTRISGLCAQIQAVSSNGGKSIRQFTSELAAGYCS
jgi:hypothetical protein